MHTRILFALLTIVLGSIFMVACIPPPPPPPPEDGGPCAEFDSLPGAPDTAEHLIIGDSILAVHGTDSKTKERQCKSAGHHIGLSMDPPTLVETKAAFGQLLTQHCTDSCLAYPETTPSDWCPRHCMERNPALVDFEKLCSEECRADYNPAECNEQCSPTIPEQYEYATNQYGLDNFKWVILNGGANDIAMYAWADRFDTLDRLLIYDKVEETYAGAMKDLVDTVKAEHADVKIIIVGYYLPNLVELKNRYDLVRVLLPLLPEFDIFEELAHLNLEISHRYRDFAHTAEAVFYLDLEEPFSISCPWPFHPSTCPVSTVDFIHPSGINGVELIGTLVNELISSVEQGDPQP